MQLLKINTTSLEDKIEQFQDSVFLNIGPSIRKIALDSILFIKGYGDYMKVQCENESFTVHITMKKLEKSLPESEFFRVHKSYLIRMDKIDRILNKHLEVNDTMIPISRNAKGDLLKMIPLVK